MIGSPFHDRTGPLNQKQQWREWSGHLAASVYDTSHIHEYFAIRNQAALIDVSPLYKYVVRGPDAVRLVDRVLSRDATKIRPGQVVYTAWCDEHGKVIDDGTVARLDDDSYRWTAADPNLRWFELNARGLDVTFDDVSDTTAAIALQGPQSRAVLEALTGTDWTDLAYFRRRSTRAGKIALDVSRTGYTGDLGYELWVDVKNALELWDRLMKVGRPFGIHAAGMLALDMTRLEAGLILLEVDYTSSRHALVPEQSYSPFEIGLGKMVQLDKKADFVGRRALLAEQAAGGPARQLVGLSIEWESIDKLHRAHNLPISVSYSGWREQRPVYSGRSQVGRATSGTWSPILKEHIALASVDKAHAAPGTQLQLEWTVEGRRGKAAARVVPLPFFDPPRKRA